jgi:hypothetical protein
MPELSWNRNRLPAKKMVTTGQKRRKIGAIFILRGIWIGRQQVVDQSHCHASKPENQETGPILLLPPENGSECQLL